MERSRIGRRWPSDRGGDSEGLQGLARGGGLNLIGAVVNQVSLFAITAILAIPLGSRDVGRYATCFALLSLLGLLSLVGFRSAMTRFVAIYLADRDAANLRGTVALGLALSLASSVTLGLLLAVFAPRVAQWYADPALVAPLRLTGLALPAATLSDAALAGTQGWRTQRPFTMIGRIIDPVSRLVVTAAVLFLGYGVVGAFWALAITSWVSAVLALGALFSRLSRLPRAPMSYPIRRIFSFSMVSWVSALASTGLIWTDTLLIGVLKGNADVGVYNVSTRIVTLAVFVMAPINAAFGPQLAHLHHVGEHAQIARIYRAASTWIVRLALPAFVLLTVFPAHILAFFGHDFATGATVTAILAVGQFVNASTGPCGTVLNMSGRVAINMVDNVAVLALDIALNLLLIPRLGIVGAAIAWSTSLAVVNLTRVVQVWRFEHVLPWTSGMLRATVAAAAAAAVALLIRENVHERLWSVVLGGVAILVVYLLVVRALGISADDRVVLQSIVRRRRKATAGAAQA